MKKKVFSLMMTLLLAFMGVAKADVVTIGEGTSTTYVTPYNSLWGYSFVEQIFTADELGTGGTITAISFNLRESDAAQTNAIDVFMKNVSRSEFSSTTDYETVAASDMVFSGTVTFSPGWTTITLDTPFEYDGVSNLMIGMHEYTSGYSTRYFYYTSATNKVITFHSDSANPDPYNLGSYSGNKYTSANRANIQIDITAGGGSGSGAQLFAVQDGEVVETVYVGSRPNGCWMEPFTFQLRNEGASTTLERLDWTPYEYFTLLEPELPAVMAHNAEIDVMVATGETTNTEWQMVAIYGTGRTAAVWPIVVEPYDPAIPDVWEMAYDFGTVSNNFSYAGMPSQITPTELHNDYTLPFPEIEEGEDAVYKFTVAQDMIISANVDEDAENGKVALYTEDFNGEGGPMATNNYTGMTLGAGAAMPFEAQIGEGTSTSGYIPFYCFYNYSLSQQLFLAAELEEAGVTRAPITSLSWYATAVNGNNQQGLTIWMANVEETNVSATSPLANTMTKVYEGSMNPVVGWNEFVCNAGSFAWDGHSNILIMFQRNNGAWASGTNWQVGAQNFTAAAYKYSDTEGPYNMEANSYSMTTTPNRANIIMKGGNREGNREIVEIGDGTGTTYYFPIDNYFNFSCTEQIYTADEIGTAGTINSISFYYNYGTAYTADNVTMYMKNVSRSSFASTTDCEPLALSDIVWTGSIAPTAAGWYTFNLDTPFQYNGTDNLLVAFFDGTSGYPGTSYTWRQTTSPNSATMALRYYSDSSCPDPYNLSSYGGSKQTYTYRANVQIGITAGGGGGSTAVNVSAGPVIENLPVAPGTYYLVASATQADYMVYFNAENMPCPAIDAEGFAFNPQPADDEDQVEPASVTLRWQVPEYATGWRLIFGTTYHPDPNHPLTVMYPEDGSFTDHEISNSYTVRNLLNNTNYFWRVEFNNDACPEGVSSPVWGFTTHLNVPQNLTAVDNTVFNDETITLNWTAVVDRTYRKYNVYRDGELIGHTQVNNIGNTTYTDGPLAYNMAGYVYYVTAVYDEGESAPSNTVTVKVSGYGDVNGHVYEMDGTTGIANATVTMVGNDEFNVSHTYNFQTNAQGYYSGHIYAGSYNGSAACDGYQSIDAPVQGNPVAITYNETNTPVDYILDENFDPVCTVIAQYYPDSLDPQSPYVKVYWGCGLPGEEIVEPFETGDFSLFDWQIDPTYPWSITTTNPYEGTYCMKSGGAGVANVVSNMTVTVNIPADGIMSFFGKISSESNWDYGYFYIDGVQKGSYTGAGSWGEKKFDITAGDHTFQWRYTKDGSVNSNDDCFYVDYITFYKRPEPVQPGWHTYLESEFDNAYRSNVGNCLWGYEYPTNIISQFAGWNLTKVAVFSDAMYNAVGGNFTCNVYVGGSTPGAGTLASTITVDVPVGLDAWCEYDLTTPVNVNGNDPIWVIWTANNTGTSLGYPAGCASHASQYGDWWNNGQDGWDHMGDCTWTMKNFFTNRDGRTVALGAADEAPVAVAATVKADSNLRTYAKGEQDITAECVNPNAVQGAAIERDATRSLSHYRIYRTDCYNDGPYTEENTVLLATNWPGDTVYIDVEWATLPAGIYKWGVGCVYAGNRGEMIETPINWAAPVAITRDATADNTTNSVAGEDNGNRAPWDLLTSFGCTSGYQYGVATDGNYIYTSSWSASSSSQFYKYDMDGNFVEEFNVAGSGQIRDLTYDGQYFYGVANSSTVYCLDLANHSLVSSFTSAYGAQRCCSYDPQRDGFWVVGNWSGNLTLIDRTGAIQFAGPAPTSASGVAYYKDADNVEHVFCFDNSSNMVYDYDIASNTIVGTVFDFNATPGYSGGSSGGCHVGEYNGMMAFFGDLQQSPNVIGVYELRQSSNPNPGGSGNNLNQLAEERESETIWSNCLEKDMYLAAGDVTLNVLLNSADNPEGSTVDFVNYNEIEQELYPIDQIVMDETGYYVFDSFRRGTYQITVQHEGYETIIDSVDIWNPIDLRYVLIEIIYGVSDLYVSSTGWAMWGDMGNPAGPGGPTGNGDTFTVDFEAGMPAGWTTIDGGSPAGYGWQLISAKIGTGYGHNGSSDGVLSQSYDNNYGVVYPDNYLVSPQVNLANGSTFSFWACAQDASYAAEHFGVFISDNGTSNWTMVNEWTIGQKGNRYEGPRGMRDQSAWTQYTVDLSAFAGQKYIAIRHFNCSDQFYLDVDDIELSNGAKSGDRHLESFKVMCTSMDGEPIFNNNVPAEQPFCQLNTETLVPGDHYICKVAAMYSTGMSGWTECEWQYIPCENYAGSLNGVTIEGNDISWDYPGGGPVPPQPGQGDTFTVDFEAGMPAGWTTIDGGSPQGYGWQLGSVAMGTGYGHNGSSDMILSKSYDNNYGVVYPDNYLVSPQVTLANGSTFSFYACAQDASYAAEHFGVFISDNGTSNWTMVNEWTIGQKGNRYEGPRGMRDQSAWTLYSVDLSAFAGQKYIAIRHFNCSDQFYLDVDDIALTSGAKSDRAEWTFANGYVTDPGAMNNGGDASWIKGSQSTFGPGCQLANGNWVADSFTLDAATTIDEITVYGYQTGSSTNSTFNGLYVQIYNGNPMNGATAVWGDANTNIMTATAFTNCYRGSDGDASGTTRPIMSITAGGLNVELEAGTYYLAYQLSGTGSSGPWAQPHAEPSIGNTGNGVQYLGSNAAWQNLSDSGAGTSYGCAMSLHGNQGGTPGPTPTGDVLGAMIFADGEWEAFVEYPTNTYTYEGNAEEVCVRIVYNGTNSLPEGNIYFSMSCPECEPFTPAPGTCVMPYDINIEQVSDMSLKVWWGEQPAAPIEEWLYYDDGANVDAIGLNGGGSFYWAIKFPASSLGNYAGCSVTKVAYFDYTAHNGIVRIYQGSNGNGPSSNMIGSYNYTANGTEDWVEWNITPASFDNTQDLWIVMNNLDGGYVASVGNYTGDPNGTMLSLDGAEWYTLSDATGGQITGTWNLRCFVSNQAKGAVEAVEMPLPSVEGGELANAGIAKGGSFNLNRDRANLVKYNVYRSTEAAGEYTMIGSVNEDGSGYYEYIDTPVEAGTYYYQVRAEYDNECESEPALAAGTGNNYVSGTTSGDGVEENGMAIYPNPTKGNVTIEANGMRHITVVSTLGQVVFDADVEGDSYIMNMSQYTAGMYTVRVVTENGVSVNRITVVR